VEKTVTIRDSSMWVVADQSNLLRGYVHRVAAYVPSGNVGVFSQGFATKAKAKRVTVNALIGQNDTFYGNCPSV